MKHNRHYQTQGLGRLCSTFVRTPGIGWHSTRADAIPEVSRTAEPTTARRSRLEVLWEARQSMRRFGQFLLITLGQGVLFLVPIVLMAVMTREAYQMLRRASQPIARLLPDDRVIGILMEDLLAVAAITLVFLIAGLFVGTRPGRMLSNRLEQTVLYRVPGYLLVRGAMGNFPGLNSDAHPQPALVETDNGWAFALLVEHLPQGFWTVFLPDAPTPTSGSVRIVEASRVRPLEASMINLLGCLTRSGARAGAIAGSILGAPRFPRSWTTKPVRAALDSCDDEGQLRSGMMNGPTSTADSGRRFRGA